VLAEHVEAAGDVPPFANSAMDGFLVAAGPAGRRLRISGESRAGAPARARPGDGEALRISTGALVPAGDGLGVLPVEVAAEEDGALVTQATRPPRARPSTGRRTSRAGAAVNPPGPRA
jgi:molybdopterin molybdotransferase